MNEPNLWFGYLHINRTVHVKRVIGDNVDDVWASDLIQDVMTPFAAQTRDEAKIIVYKHY